MRKLFFIVLLVAAKITVSCTSDSDFSSQPNLQENSKIKNDFAKTLFIGDSTETGGQGGQIPPPPPPHP
ncbi:hypothetical protein [Flavobacterium sp.]|uniref:hypothetical protein n=1 Tax=Flavobacterium sp. TaxID=239 RepID=UPI003750B185